MHHNLKEETTKLMQSVFVADQKLESKKAER